MAQMPRNRAPSPERWQKAAQRAVEEGITVRQCNDSGMWVANSGTPAVLLAFRAALKASCSRAPVPAGVYGDPCCQRAARYYLMQAPSSLFRRRQPLIVPTATAAASTMTRAWSRPRLLYPTCRGCGGSGVAPSPALAA